MTKSFREAREEITGDSWLDDLACASLRAAEAKFSGHQPDFAALDDAQPGMLAAAIECVLLDHADQLDGENVDANLSELAHVYERITGWTVARALAEDTP